MTAKLPAVGAFLAPVFRRFPGLRKQVLDLVESVRLTEDAGTARVVYEGRKIRLELSPEFAKRHLRSVWDRAFVLLHELMHVERGDLVREGRLHRRFPRLVNLALDIHVNAAVLERYFNASNAWIPFPLFERLYPADQLPAALLLPPPVLLARSERRCAFSLGAADAAMAAIHRSRKAPGGQARLEAQVERIFSTIRPGTPMRDLARVYVAGWSRSLPFSTFLERLLAALLDAGLLGDVEGLDLPLLHALDELERLGHGRTGSEPGQGREVQERTVDPALRAAAAEQRALLLRAIRAALVTGPAARGRPVLDLVLAPSVLPHLGRREAVLLACGVPPVLSSAPLSVRQPPEQRLHLYLDVSGSMDDLLPFLFGLVASLREVLSSPVYLFSNRVVEVTLEQLARGEVKTTGGTDLDCVAEHAAKHGVQRLLVVTDGYLRLSPARREHLADQVACYAVLTQENTMFGSMYTGMEGVFTKTWTITL